MRRVLRRTRRAARSLWPSQAAARPVLPHWVPVRWRGFRRSGEAGPVLAVAAREVPSRESAEPGPEVAPVLVLVRAPKSLHQSALKAVRPSPAVQGGWVRSADRRPFFRLAEGWMSPARWEPGLPSAARPRPLRRRSRPWPRWIPPRPRHFASAERPKSRAGRLRKQRGRPRQTNHPGHVRPRRVSGHQVCKTCGTQGLARARRGSSTPLARLIMMRVVGLARPVVSRPFAA